MIGRILYTALVDLSLPYGPGINERSFLRDMSNRLGDSLLAVVPRPVRGLPVELGNLNVRYIPSWSSVRSLIGWVQGHLVGVFVLRQAIARFKPDLMVIRSGALPLSQVLITKTCRVPYVVKTSGDTEFRHFYRRGRIRGWLSGPNELLVRRLLCGAECVDVVSSAHRDTMIERNPCVRSSVHVIDNGVDLEHFGAPSNDALRRRLGFGTEDVVIGYAGTVPMRRGGKEVIESVALNSGFRNVRGLIIGDSGEARECRQYAEECGVGDRVVIYGEADYEEMPFLLQSMDVGLSIRRPTERVASELKVRQYLASGLCVVGTVGTNDFLRNRSFARVVEDCGPRGAPVAVRAFIRRGRSGIARLGRRARRFAEAQLSVAARNDERLDLWERNMQGRRRRRAGKLGGRGTPRGGED